MDSGRQRFSKLSSCNKLQQHDRHKLTIRTLETDPNHSEPPKLRKRPIRQFLLTHSPEPKVIDHSYISKLNLTIKTKEVFIMKDGSSVTQGQKVPGFYYSVLNLDTNARSQHIKEMKEFYKYCKEFYKNATDFKFLYNYTGKSLRCLHEAEFNDKILMVSDNSQYIGIFSENVVESSSHEPRSPLFKYYNFTYDSPDVSKGINSQFIFNAEKYNLNSMTPTANSHFERAKDSFLPSINGHREHKILNNSYSKLGFLEKLKFRLGAVTSNIDKTFTSIRDQGLKQLKEKYKFKESELHKFYAKYKLLVLLSCGIDPSHKISSGINRKAFIDYYKTSKEIEFVLGRVFDKFDSDGGGTISWVEYLTAMSIMWKGSYDQQVDLFFEVYDLTGTGALSYAEIQQLCKLQLQVENSDQLIDDLADSFASLVFDITKTPYSEEISKETIKSVINLQNDKSLIEMFCSFHFLK